MGAETLTKQIINLLCKGWFSNYQLDMYFKSSSAARIMRFIRKNPPENMKVISREKERIEGYKGRPCLEYTMISEE